jgi:carbon monoxide dehydrogenase subunit G
MAVELDHPFSTAKPIDENWAAILDLERVVPAVEGGRVIEMTGPHPAKAEIKVKMGAMSMTFTGTVEVTEQDAAAHRAVITVKSREAGGQGHANATVMLALNDGAGRSTPTRRSPARPRRWARE